MDRQLYLAPGRILLEKNQESEMTTKGGVIILRGTKTSLISGTVVAVGPGSSEREMEVSVGDEIFFKKGAELDVEYDDKKYWLLDWNSYLMGEKV